MNPDEIEISYEESRWNVNISRRILMRYKYHTKNHDDMEISYEESRWDVNISQRILMRNICIVYIICVIYTLCIIRIFCIICIICSIYNIWIICIICIIRIILLSEDLTYLLTAWSQEMLVHLKRKQVNDTIGAGLRFLNHYLDIQ